MTAPLSHTAGARMRVARLATLASCLGLILLYSVDSLVLADSAPNPLLWAVRALPIAAFLPALARGRTRAYQWLCFLILAYFIHGVLDVFTPARATQGALEIFLCVALFASAIVFVHGRRASASD